jgi:ABC-type Fe3+-siderophore transport system permease subunit
MRFILLVKIALTIVIFWLIGLLVPYEIGNVMYAFPPIAIAMIMVSGHRRRIKYPNDY